MIKKILLWSQALDNSGDDAIFIFKDGKLKKADGKTDWDYIVDETTKIVDNQDGKITEDFIEAIYSKKLNSIKFDISTNDLDNAERQSYISATVFLDDIQNLNADVEEIKKVITKFGKKINRHPKENFGKVLDEVVEKLFGIIKLKAKTDANKFVAMIITFIVIVIISVVVNLCTNRNDESNSTNTNTGDMK